MYFAISLQLISEPFEVTVTSSDTRFLRLKNWQVGLQKYNIKLDVEDRD